MTDLTLASARADRDALADRTDVLDKVKVLRTLPEDMPRYHGCIYVIAFSDGSIKVGRSQHPKKRLRTHFNKAAEHGIGVADLWVSDGHVEYAENEAALIGFLNARAVVRVRETFTSASFAKVARFAKQLPSTSLSEAEIANRLRQEMTWTRDEAAAWIRRGIVIPKGGGQWRRSTEAEIEMAVRGGVV